MSNARTATKGGSPHMGRNDECRMSNDEIRDTETLWYAVALAIWETIPGDKTHPVPFAELGPDGEAEQMASAVEACRVIAMRVVLPEIRRCVVDRSFEALSSAVPLERFFILLTGEEPLPLLLKEFNNRSKKRKA